MARRMHAEPAFPWKEAVPPVIHVVPGRRHRQYLATWFQDAVDLADDRLRIHHFVQQTTHTNDIDRGILQGQAIRAGVHEPTAQAPQLKVATDQAELVGRWTADDYGSSMPSILQPIGAQAVAQSQERFAGVLGKLQQARNPAAGAAVALVLDVEEPL